MPPWSDQVLAYWFGELSPAAWFMRSEALDQAIRDRFMKVHGRVAADAAAIEPSSPEAVAAVIVLDQFSRNMFRGTPAAFASDPAALALAKRIISVGADSQWPTSWRPFLYLPFEHTEDRDLHAQSVALFDALGDARSLDYARRHQVVIERFGRFPHRNAILGRVSTAAEVAYLAEPGSGF